MAMSDQSAVSKDLDLTLAGHAISEEARRADNDQRLSTIFEIAKIMATQHDMEAMLAEFLSCLVETLQAPEAGLMLLYDPSDACLVGGSAQVYDLARLRRLRLSLGEAGCGETFRTGEVQLYSTPKAVAAETRSLTPANRKIFQEAIIGQRQLRCAICVPLFTGETRVGILWLENRHQPGSFAGEDILFLEAVADLMALSIENARLREELQATRALEEANRLKAELISTLAHEMRTPLTSIKGYSTALLMEEAAFSPDTQREFLHIIDEECDILQDLIRDLLESSIIDAGLLRLEPQPVRLPRLAKRLTEDIAHRTQKHRFLIDFPRHFPIVDADPNRIEQVLRNLLDNALKYSPLGGLVVIRGEVREGEVVISVADQGVGIAPEHLNRLFEKFFRVKSALGRHVVGSGLGLPIARTIVESHGGRIWAESQLDQGSTFYFTLPLEGLSQELAEQKELQNE